MSLRFFIFIFKSLFSLAKVRRVKKKINKFKENRKEGKQAYKEDSTMMETMVVELGLIKVMIYANGWSKFLGIRVSKKEVVKVLSFLHNDESSVGFGRVEGGEVINF